jgi:hypothetical protein
MAVLVEAAQLKSATRAWYGRRAQTSPTRRRPRQDA